MRALQDTVVLVSGATDGLGRGVAQRLAAQGARLMLHGRNRDRLDAVARELGPETRVTTHLGISPRSTRCVRSPTTCSARPASSTC